ncbi:protein kinase APK1A chloroplastic-like, partial [Trifolium medium]|nr:protein kinase APK1A chloroplastic-like [Trifolium medium]
MGGCFSARFKAERQSPSHNGLNSKVDGREDGVLSMLQTSRTLKCFTLEEIKTATRNAIPDRQEDELCCVKGWIDRHTLAPTKQASGLAISVKQLNHVIPQERSEWLVSVIR